MSSGSVSWNKYSSWALETWSIEGEVSALSPLVEMDFCAQVCILWATEVGLFIGAPPGNSEKSFPKTLCLSRAGWRGKKERKAISGRGEPRNRAVAHRTWAEKRMEQVHPSYLCIAGIWQSAYHQGTWKWWMGGGLLGDHAQAKTQK